MSTAPTIQGRFCNKDGTPVSPVSTLPADFLTREFIYFQGEKDGEPVTFAFQVIEVRATVIADQTIHGICIAHYAPPKPSRLSRLLTWLNASFGQAAIGNFALIAVIWLISITIWPTLTNIASEPAAYTGLLLWNMDDALLYMTTITVVFSTFYFIFKDKYFWATAPIVFWVFVYLALIKLFAILPTPDGFKPEVWPTDYARYAKDFFDSQATALAALKISMPALIAILNLIGLTVVGKLVDIALKAAGTRAAQKEEEDKAAAAPQEGRTTRRSDAGVITVLGGQSQEGTPQPEPILRLPLSAANA